MNVIIVGGGFGGVKTALELSRHRGITVTLISDRDHMLFYPTLYDVASGGSAKESVIPLSEIFNKKSVKVIIDKVVNIDPVKKLVYSDGGNQYHYDNLVMATGVVTSYFGIRGLHEYSYSIKSAAEVQRFREHLHSQAEHDHKMDKHYVIVGGGPTGTELAAAIKSYLDSIALAHHASRNRFRVTLIEGADRLLPRMSLRTSKMAEKRLKKLGIQIILSSRVQGESSNQLILDRGKIPTHTVVWTSGTANNPFFKDHEDLFEINKFGRVVVDKHLQAIPHVFVIGDNADTPYSGLAQTALYDAKFVSRVLVARHFHYPMPTYKPRKPPVVLPVGDRWALFEYGQLRIYGFIAAIIRNMADLVGYAEVLPLARAINLWLSRSNRDEQCSLCLDYDRRLGGKKI